MAIGAYTAPSEQTAKTPTTPAGAVAAGIENDLQDDIKENQGREQKNKSYTEILKDNNILVNDAQAIVDDLMTKGYYSEDIQVTKRITVTFRTRSHNDYLRYNTALQILNPRFKQEEEELAIRYCLAGSICRFDKTNFEHPVPKTEDAEVQRMFDARLDWIEKQPERLIALLAVKLNKFDQRIMVVMSEGVAENF